MKITATAIKLAAFSSVVLLFTAAIVVVFGQVRFSRTTGYAAIFSTASGLRAGQFVRAAGVEVGKVTKVQLIDEGTRARVEFHVDQHLPLYQETTAAIRYQNLLGDRYLEIKRGDNNKALPGGSTIPIERTEPALDLDALIGGFKPLFHALEPQKVNAIAQSLLTVLQGQGGTISEILDQTAQFTSTLADHDQAIGEVIDNLNIVLSTTVNHQRQFDDTVQNFQRLIRGLKDRKDPIAESLANMSNAAGTLADLLADNRAWVHDTVNRLGATLQPLADEKDEVNDLLVRAPATLKMLGRAGGIYGDFFNFYLCDLTVMVNGLQPGGPVRTIKLLQQPTGRCTPQ
jgi:phospholipid/cholesterol/gamma-HCH transport system substrate-binding protein